MKKFNSKDLVIKNVLGKSYYDYQIKVIDGIKDSLNSIGEAGFKGFTNSGKTNIAAEIIAEFIINNPDKRVVWISRKSVNDNIQIIFDKISNDIGVDLNSNISYINFSELARDSGTKFDHKKHSKAGLIVIDECHNALAEKTYETLSKILNRHKTAYKLMLTATDYRPSDNRNAFEELVPKASADNTLIEASLQGAIANNIVNPIDYYVIAKEFKSYDIDMLKRYKSIAYSFEDTKNMYDDIASRIVEYNEDKSNKIYNALYNIIYSNDSTNCDRHIAFFSTVENLLNEKDTIQKTFNRLYPKCKVNLHEYYGKISKKSKDYILNNIINGEPKPGVVDIILTVNLGGESIHPKNMKSILMMRNTSSNIVYTQEIGRVVSFNTGNPKKVYVFDFCNNIILFGRTTIGTGVRSTSDRVTDGYTNINDQLEKIQNELKDKFRVESVNCSYQMQQILEDYSKLTKLCKSAIIPLDLARLYNQYKNDIIVKDFPSCRNILDVHADKHEILVNSPDNEIFKWYEEIHRRLRNRAIKKDSKIRSFIDILGHIPFLSDRSDDKENEELYMGYVDTIYSSFKISKNLNELGRTASRYYNILLNKSSSRTLNTNVAAYAYYKGITFNVESMNSTNIVKNYKKSLSTEECKYITNIENGLKKLSNGDAKNKDLTLVRLIVIKRKFGTSIQLNEAIASIISLYKEAFNSNFDKSEIQELERFANFYSNAKLSGILMGDMQLDLMRHSYDISAYSDSKKLILKELNIDQTILDKFKSKTKWFMDVQRFLSLKNKTMLNILADEAINSKIDYWINLGNQLKNSI